MRPGWRNWEALRLHHESFRLLGGEWRDTKKMIKKAEKLLAKGKTKKALKQVMMAEAQGMLGHMRATMQDLHI